MASAKLILLGVLAALSYASVSAAAVKEKVIYCYYGTWATYRPGVGQFNTEDVNTTLCTHIAYTFMGVNNDSEVISLDPFLDLPDDGGRNNLAAFTALKKQNSNLKTMLAIGGFNQGSARFSILAADPARRAVFIKSVLEWIFRFGFDGADMDWEYPARGDSVNGNADIENFSQLLKELREEFDKQATPLLLAADVSAVRSAASQSYNIPEISKYLDFINIMTYDLNGAWDPFTGFNAPLYRGAGDDNVADEDLLTVNAAITYWLKSGAPAEKILMGIPFYGRTFTLADENNNGVRAPATGPGTPGPYTAEAGTIAYGEFCVQLQDSSWVEEYDKNARVPYAHKGKEWVSYDTPKTITTKAEYAEHLNLAGVVVWSLESDDFRGACGKTNPLLKAINKALGRPFK